MHGATIAVVCNGPQLALFQALTPGSPPLDGECYFFNGFEDYQKNFSLLWQLLSPEGITENLAARLLAQHRIPRIPPRASEFIAEPNKFRYRSEFQEKLRSLSDLLLEEVEDNPALKSSFYRECYVPMEANNRHLLLSKKIIDSRYNRLDDQGIRPTQIRAGINTAITSDPVFVEGLTSRPIVVIGDVGVGKTSFFENLYENFDHRNDKHNIFIHLNLGIKANLSNNLKSFVISDIQNTLYSKYNIDIEEREFLKSVYHDEIDRFDKTLEGSFRYSDPCRYDQERYNFLKEKLSQKDLHLQASLAHLCWGRHFKIIIIIDNADQRDFDIQQEAFLIAQELASKRNALVFIALRPSTFYRSKLQGALSAYQNKILTISPPPADQVIQKRITFAVRVAEGKIQLQSIEGVRLHLKSVVLFFKATLRSIKSNDSIKTFLSNITGGNTRQIIELISDFFGSPNVDSEKIVRIEEEKGNYVVPLHEFTKHALLGQYAYYNPDSSLVAFNLFDVSSPDPREHFLSSLIIAYLSSNIFGRDSDGYVRGQNIADEMAKSGFIIEQVRNALKRLAIRRLIETAHAHYRELEVDDAIMSETFNYRVTSSGIYHVRYWTGTFAFLDAMSTDTPIFNQDARDEVVKLAESFFIKDRLHKTTIFKQYLETKWDEASITVPYYNFTEYLASADNSFEDVRRVVDRDKVPRIYRKIR